MDNQQNPPAKAQNPKQQVVEALKNASNVLVTVSTNPSVDQLSACIGLTLMMNKLDKHATAVFSGMIPSTLEFLQPEKTLESNTDSLRDFIISLDKSKADKLRYKVEDDVVRIYITPYRTSISSADLEFTQGDFNVDVVVALGVNDKDHLDQAIIEHGRILHDAVVLGLSCGTNPPSDLGAINWHEPGASSLSEMLVSISESFKTGLLDTQMSTAFLTGIVSETDRFSNEKTTPKVMTMSAQLMAAGANQQLIANQLAIPPEPEPEPEPMPMAYEEQPISTQDPVPAAPPEEPGVLHIDQPEPVQEPYVPVEPPVQVIEQGSGENGIEFSVRKEETHAIPVDKVVDKLGVSGQDVTDTSSDPTELHIDNPPEIEIDEHGKMVDLEVEAEEKRDRQQHKIIQPLNAPAPQPKTDLTNYVFEQPAMGGTLTANAVPEQQQVEQTVDPLSGEVPAQAITIPAPSAEPPKDSFDIDPSPQTLADLEKAVNSPHANEEQPQPKQGPQGPPPVPPPLPQQAPGAPGEINLPPPQQ